MNWMIRRFSSDARMLCAAAAFMMLIGTIPQAAGVMLVTNSAGPAFTLDICHPLPGLDLNTGIVIAAPEMVFSLPALNEAGAVIDPQQAGITEISSPPDAPPPKANA